MDDRVEDGRVDVYIRDALFTSYHYGHQWVRPFLHPLNGPVGVRMTRSWPIEGSGNGESMDHPHHKSLWVAYGECGSVDNWSEDPGHGFQRHRAFTDQSWGPVLGRLAAKTDWCTNSERKQFEESRALTFYAVTGGEYLMDVSVTFRMTQGGVTFRDTKEGGLLSVRVASAMEVDHGGRIENAYGGINEDETWGRKSPWCDYSGTIDGHSVGVAVMDHSSNPRYPTEWHVRNYGLMTANCFGWKYYRPGSKVRGDMTFRKGSTTTWRYRVFLHKGDARRGRVAERFIDFVFPPRVAIDA